jgi:hypothetical protein
MSSHACRNSKTGLVYVAIDASSPRRWWWWWWIRRASLDVPKLDRGETLDDHFTPPFYSPFLPDPHPAAAETPRGLLVASWRHHEKGVYCPGTKVIAAALTI